MKTLTLLAVCSMFTLNAHATYPVSFNCQGVSKNQEKIQFSLKGLISSDPAAKKETGTLTLNLQGQTNKGEIKISNQQVHALKTKYASLVMYSVSAKVQSVGHDQIVIAVTNKNNGSSTLSFFDTRSAGLDSIEYNIACAEEVK
jgi:hypothetical protein